MMKAKLSTALFKMEWKHKNSQHRFFMALGALFLLAAVVGVFIPIIPQVPFAIISAYFFSKGSLIIHQAMRYNRYFGKPVRDWEDYRIIRPKMKIIATVSMIVGAVLTYLKFSFPVAMAIDGCFLMAIIFVLTRRSKLGVREVLSQVR